MSSFLIYGKRTQPIRNTNTGEMMGPDLTFRALDWNGKRVTKLVDAFEYATREDAQERLDKVKGKPGVVFEIRKAK